jgi:N-acetylmuramoyl-L-alanine amidase
MIIKYTNKEKDLLARLMRAEALGEGALGMLMVGNVVVNRVLADCYTFKDMNTLEKVINQSPGGFSGVSSSLYYGSPTTKERNLANRVLKGEYYYPATNSLWFYASSTTCSGSWYDQSLAGKYKTHCFYQPNVGICSQVR